MSFSLKIWLWYQKWFYPIFSTHTFLMCIPYHHNIGFLSSRVLSSGGFVLSVLSGYRKIHSSHIKHLFRINHGNSGSYVQDVALGVMSAGSFQDCSGFFSWWGILSWGFFVLDSCRISSFMYIQSTVSGQVLNVGLVIMFQDGVMFIRNYTDNESYVHL